MKLTRLLLGTVTAGQPVKLDSSKSTPGTGAIVGHVWDLDGNGSFETFQKQTRAEWARGDIAER